MSAMVDGELRSEACSRLLSLLDTDADLRRAWERFHLIGDAMRQDLPEVPLDALSTRTQEALRSEPVLIRPRPRLTIPLRPVAGLALAASVAVVAVLGVRTINSGPPGAEIASLTIASVPVFIVYGTDHRSRGTPSGHANRHSLRGRATVARCLARKYPLVECPGGGGSAAECLPAQL